MRCIVVGAGNAGRPVARILNYVGHDVILTDNKVKDDFSSSVQEILRSMENEGVTLHLGSDTPNMESWDMAYVSPTVPLEASIRHRLMDRDIALISNKDISSIINEVLELDVIGVTGTLGKTSTTHLISEIFQDAGYRVWTCSSLNNNLLSEYIVEGIVQGQHEKNDLAVLELPHGTSRLTSQVKLKVGVLTNIHPEHLAEFEGSMEKYTARKLLITHSSEIFITHLKCKETVTPVRDDAIFYGLNSEECHFSGEFHENNLKIKYRFDDVIGLLETPFQMLGYYRENATAAAAAALCYGLARNEVGEALGKFTGIPAHMEYIGEYCGRKVYFDAAYLPEGMRPTLDCFPGHRLVVLIDNPDSSTPRDKPNIGKILGEYAQVIISSGYNETIGKLDMAAAREVLHGAKSSDATKILVEDIQTAGILSIKHSKPGDTILHVGPGAVSAYKEVKSKMIAGIKKGCDQYGHK